MRRSERLVLTTKRLIDHPNRAISLSEFAEGLGAAKSSLSEDIALIRGAFVAEHEGTIDTIQGAGGGVKFRVATSPETRSSFINRMIERLSERERILPGGFLYMSDVLGDSAVLDTVGRLFAEEFAHSDANVVVTVETKGIPLAVSTARYLNVPVAIVRREHRVTEGPALSVHYVSGSERRIQTMSISTRAMPHQARALIVDDFMRAGATARAVTSLLSEFSARVVGTAVFMATDEPKQKLISDYYALVTLGELPQGQSAPPIRAFGNGA